MTQGVLISPLAVTPALAIWELAGATFTSHSPGGGFFAYAALGTLIAFPVVMIYGLPVYLIANHFYRNNFLLYFIAGAGGPAVFIFTNFRPANGGGPACSVTSEQLLPSFSGFSYAGSSAPRLPVHILPVSDFQNDDQQPASLDAVDHSDRPDAHTKDVIVALQFATAVRSRAVSKLLNGAQYSNAIVPGQSANLLLRGC